MSKGKSISTNYNHTIYACYIGYITQAIVNNFLPLLFLTFRKQFGLSLDRITLLTTINFGVQLCVDLLSAKFVDRIGYRKCMMAAHVLAALGLVGVAVFPFAFPDPYAGLLLAVVLYAVGGGILEVLVSPIVEACPTDNKEAVMSLLHSFYCWGAVGAIALSTLFFVLFGTQNWRILTCLWASVPLYNVNNFRTCPIEPIVKDGASMSISRLFQTKIFWLFVLLMVCSGASEASMAQWASAFAESSLGISKTAGDLLGPCGFAVFMGISRVLYSRLGEKVDLNRFMIFSGILCLCSYLLAAFASLPAMGLTGCMLCGFSVGIMWPGSISISSSKLPKGGTALFAFLALAGDLGAAAGPALVGNISQLLGGNIQVGIAAGLIFPALLVLTVLMLKRNSTNKI